MTYQITVHPKGDLASIYYMDSVESAVLLFKTWYAEKNEKICRTDEDDAIIVSSAQAYAVIVPHHAI